MWMRREKGFEPLDHYIPLSAPLTQTQTIYSDSFYFHNTQAL